MTTNDIKLENFKIGANTVENLNGKDSLSSGPHVMKVKLDDYGYTEAGRHMGNAKALENFLGEISEGHLVDMNHSDRDILKQQQVIEASIGERKNEIISRTGRMETLQDVIIPDKEESVREKLDEIKRLETEKINGKTISAHSPMMLWIWGSLSILLGIYLVMFYASAINSVFFRNLLQELAESGTSGNVSIILNSIFDPGALFRFTSSTLYIYFGSTLFFALGLLAHHFLVQQLPIWKKVIVCILAFLIPFCADALLAYKIHSNIVEAKSLMGIEDTATWYESMNFWLVIVFGYIAYMTWAIVFGLFHTESDKKDPAKSFSHLIQNLRKEIRLIKEEIRQHHSEISEIKSQISALKEKLDNLQKQLKNVLKDPNLLLHNLHQFYSGWLLYLNAGKMAALTLACDELFKQFLQENFTSVKQ